MNVLVTGGASGLGESITLALLQEGHTVYFTYNNSLAKAKEIEKSNANAKPVFCNFTDASSVDQLLQEMEKMDLQVLINNALTGLQQNHFHKLSAAEFTNGFQNNILPTIKITQKAILHFRKQKAGRIITVASSYINGLPPIGLSMYVAEKNYILSLSNSWAAENIKFNIASNCVSPSFMQTGLTASTDERIIEQMVNDRPDKKILTTHEAAKAVLYLLNAPSNITGTNLLIDSAKDIPQ